MDEPFDIDAMVATARSMMDIGKKIPIGVRLHPLDYAMLVKECTEPPNPHAFDLPVYRDYAVPRGKPKFMYREDRTWEMPMFKDPTP